MQIDEQNLVHIKQRLSEHTNAEASQDAVLLHRFIDPEIRNNYDDDERARNLASIEDYTSQIQNAAMLNFTIDAYTDCGGLGPGNRPTAIVKSKISYNDGRMICNYRTPWVLHDGQWYTRATGRIKWKTQDTN